MIHTDYRKNIVKEGKTFTYRFKYQETTVLISWAVSFQTLCFGLGICIYIHMFYTVFLLLCCYHNILCSSYPWRPSRMGPKQLSQGAFPFSSHLIGPWMDLVNYEKTFAGGFWERKFVFSPEKFTRKKKKISPWLDMSEEVCRGPDYWGQSSWHHADNCANDKLMVWKAEWKEIRPWWLYQPDQTSSEALPPWTILLFEPTDSIYCLSQFNLRFLWLATWGITIPNSYYCFRALKKKLTP